MKVAIFACIVGIVGIALAIPHPTSRNVGKVGKYPNFCYTIVV